MIPKHTNKKLNNESFQLNVDFVFDFDTDSSINQVKQNLF